MEHHCKLKGMLHPGKNDTLAFRAYLCQQVLANEFQRAFVRPELLTSVKFSASFSGDPCEVNPSNQVEHRLPRLGILRERLTR